MTAIGGRISPLSCFAARQRGALRRSFVIHRLIWLDLALVFSLAFGFRLLWVFLIPPWAAPDEPAHFAYVAHIVEQREIPVRETSDRLPVFSKELETSIKVTLLSKISTVGSLTPVERTVLPANYDYAVAREYEAPEPDRLNAGGASATPYPPLYYLSAAVPYWLFQGAPILSRLYAARVDSALLGALSCVFGYLAGFEVCRKRAWGLALGLSMALLPMYCFITSSVNNDAAMVCVATALVWLGMRLLRENAPSRRFVFGLGLLCGIALLAKPTALPIVVVIAGLLAWKVVPRRRRSQKNLPQSIALLARFAAGGVLSYGPWLLYRTVQIAGAGQTGADQGASDIGLALSAVAAPRYSLWSYLHYLHGVGGSYFETIFINGYWGSFGWLEYPLPEPAIRAIEVFYVVGLAGLLAVLLCRPRFRSPLILAGGFVLAQMAFVFFVIDYQYSFARTGQSLGLQGRYLYPALAPLLFGLLCGWSQIFDDHPMVLRLTPAFVLILQLVGLSTLLLRFYGVTFG